MGLHPRYKRGREWGFFTNQQINNHFLRDDYIISLIISISIFSLFLQPFIFIEKMKIDWFNIIQQTLVVSGFVLILMVIIEYINVRTAGKWNKGIGKNRFFQLIVSILLNLMPGCAGIFAVVSLYTHDIFGFSALLGASLATFGDEAFMIYATSPKTGLHIMLSLAVFSIIFGTIFTFISIKTKTHEKHLETHGDACCHPVQPISEISHELRKITTERAFLLTILLLLIINVIVPIHGYENPFSTENLLFLFFSLISIFIVLTVPEHFLKEHIWEHVLKKHFLRLFLWTLGTIAFIQLLQLIFPFQQFISNNYYLMLLAALIIGILPVSGPHLIFFTLFMQGLIPFSILLANSIVQEGHGGIPLLAEDKKAFVLIKIIKIALALIVGIIGIRVGF